MEKSISITLKISAIKIVNNLSSLLVIWLAVLHMDVQILNRLTAKIFSGLFVRAKPMSTFLPRNSNEHVLQIKQDLDFKHIQTMMWCHMCSECMYKRSRNHMVHYHSFPANF